MESTLNSGDGTTTAVPTLAPTRPAQPRRAKKASAKTTDAPSVAWLRANRKDLLFTEKFKSFGIDRYASLLVHFERAAETGAPAFLSDLPHYDSEARPSILSDSGLKYGVSADTDSVGSLLRNMRDLMASAAVVRAFNESDAFIPTDRRVRPRVALQTQAQVMRGRKQPDGQVRYECDLTRRPFLLAPSAPVPCLLFDQEAADGTFTAEYECMGPADTNMNRKVIHPALFVAGPEYVLAAFWSHLDREVSHAFETLALVMEEATLLFGLEPDGVKAEWPSRALYDFGDWRPLRTGGDTTPITDRESDDLRVPSGWVKGD